VSEVSVKPVKRNHIPLIAAVLALCIGAGVLFASHVQAAAAPSLFHNDERWYRDSSAGVEVMHGIYYVPVDIFGMFSHIELSIDSRGGEFMVYNRTTKQYISVLYDERIATVNGEEEKYLNLYKLHGGYYYVPAEFFCQVLSLQCESAVSSSTGYGLSFRICDGTQTKTMEQLLSAYDAVTSAPQDSTADTAPPPPVTSGGDSEHRVNYLTFNTVSGGYLPQILRALRANNLFAAVFFTEEELREYPELVIAVAAGGHTVGLLSEGGSSAEEILNELSSANGYLYSLIKQETRIVQLKEEGEETGLTGEDLQQIERAGYVLWGWTYDVPDSVGYTVEYVRSRCERAVLQSEINVFRMSCNGTSASVLPGFLQFLSGNGNYEVRQIRASEQEVRTAAS